MKRAVICVRDPWSVIPKYQDHSIMVINPDSAKSRLEYLLSNSDFDILVTEDGVTKGSGQDHGDKKIFLYTSGTTGDSKFYGFTRAQVDSVCDSIIRSYELSSNDRYFGVMPLWHAHGLLMYLTTQRAGCQTNFGTINDLKDMEKFQPTWLSAIPDILMLASKLDLRNLRFIRSASAALTEKNFLSLKDRFGVPVLEAFGITEAVSHCFTNPLHGKQKIGTVGLPDGIEARVDEQNHLWIQGPSVFRPGWFDTGDLAAQDEDGYFRILGRSVDRINVRGYKIDPLSIENQLYNEFEDIKEVAVFGRDRLKCVYVGDVDLHKISAFLVSLGTACRPKLLQQIDEIPKNTVGKINRSLLDQHFS